MKLINGNCWINLEEHLDMNSFDLLEDQIHLAIANNTKYIEPSYTPHSSLLDRTHPGFLEKKKEHKTGYPNLDNVQLNWYTKLSGAVTLGTQLILRGNKGYPDTYKNKHLNEFSVDMPCKNDFDFLFKWVEDQKCFTEYGRTMFWINEPSQKTALHTDYGNFNIDKRDMFIWITGRIRKKLLIKNTETGEILTSPYRAMVFNTINWHGSCGHEELTSWSLRVDGVFNPEWAARVGIKEYYNL